MSIVQIAIALPIVRLIEQTSLLLTTQKESSTVAINIFSLIIGSLIIIFEKRFWVRCASLVLIIITTLVLLNEISFSFKFWPNHLDKKLYRSELQLAKPELIGKENKPLMKVIWYQKDKTNLLLEQKYDVFLIYTEKLYLLYPILAFTFLLIAVNKNKTYERAVWMFAGSLFLALMLIILQLNYIQWEQKQKLKYDTIKKELIKQSTGDNKEPIESLPKTK